MKRRRKEGAFLEQVRMIPNVSLACEKVDLSRNTVYRWCKEDPEFQARLDAALETGTESVNDLAESKLIAHLNNGSLRAIEYWLDNHKKAYARPRPKSFWEEMFGKDGPITTVNVITADPEQIRKRKKVLLTKQVDPGTASDPVTGIEITGVDPKKISKEKKESVDQLDEPAPAPSPPHYKH